MHFEMVHANAANNTELTFETDDEWHWLTGHSANSLSFPKLCQIFDFLIWKQEPILQRNLGALLLTLLCKLEHFSGMGEIVWINETV
jgi:hypothetical protein